MPTTRGALSVAVVNDTLYALGGTANFPNPQAGVIAANEQYFPLGYGELLPSSPTSLVMYIGVTAVVVVIIAIAAVLVNRKQSNKTKTNQLTLNS